MEVFQEYAYYYNAFYRDKNYQEEAEQIDTLLKRYGENVTKLINFGCGTGRHDMELVKMGYACTGIDMSPMMIELAREQVKEAGVELALSVEDIRSFRSEKKYDGVISLFHVMSYQNENSDILSAFQSARSVLESGGIFLFDVWYGPGVLSDAPAVRVKEAEDERFRLVRIARPAMYDTKNIVDVNYEIFIIDKKTGKVKVVHETHKMRYFFRPELEFLLKEAGFELLDNLDCQTLTETDFRSWTSYFMARAV